MGRFLDVLAVLLGWTIYFSNGAVTLSIINSVDGVNTLECNTEVILVCKVNPYLQLINWQINSTLYAMCSPGCIDNPPFPGNYSFTFDVTNGVFNTTINQVTYGDSSTEFRCDDGSTSDSITTEVVPAYSENVTSINDERNQIIFTTACVHPGVQFKWYTVKSDNSDQQLYTLNQNERKEDTSCTLDTKCGGTETVKVSSSIEVSTVADGEERFFKVVVTYSDPSEERTFRFDEPFILEGCKLKSIYILLLIFAVRWIQLIQSYFAGASQCILHTEELTGNVLYMILFILTCLPVIGIPFALVLVLIWPEGTKKSCGMQFPLAVIGNFPIVGTCITAFLLFYCQIKELRSVTRCLFFGIGWFCDSVILVVMILTCTAVIEVPCWLYGPFAVVCWFTSWVNFVCLAHCLYLQTRVKPENICTLCQQINLEIKATKRCDDCNECFCDFCLHEHLNKHEELRNAVDHMDCTEGHNLHQTPENFVCRVCKDVVEGYCLSCDSYLCINCFKHQASHRILGHRQQSEKLGRIMCKPCQTNGKRVPAECYLKLNKFYTCCNCLRKQFTSQGNVVYLHDEKLKCPRCEENEDKTFRPVECRCLVYNEDMCTVCFEKIRKQSLLKHNPLKTRISAHDKLCDLHSVSGWSVTKRSIYEDEKCNEQAADVYCRVCDAFLCTRCFILHLDLKQLWRQQQSNMHFVEYTLNKSNDRTNHISNLHTDDLPVDLPVVRIFLGCFPVLGIPVLIFTWYYCKGKQETIELQGH